MVLLAVLLQMDVEVVLREYFNFSHCSYWRYGQGRRFGEDLCEGRQDGVGDVSRLPPREAAVARTRHVLLAMRGLKWPRYGTCVVEVSSSAILFYFPRLTSRFQRHWYRALPGAVSKEASLESSY